MLRRDMCEEFCMSTLSRAFGNGARPERGGGENAEAFILEAAIEQSTQGTQPVEAGNPKAEGRRPKAELTEHSNYKISLQLAKNFTSSSTEETRLFGENARAPKRVRVCIS
jgi:hypothetical protein